MKHKSDLHKLETYLERPEAYEGGLAPEIEGLTDALQQWPQEAALQPRPGFLNELARQLDVQEQPPLSSAGWRTWFRPGRLLRGAAAAAVALAALLFFGLWLASLSSPASGPVAAGPETTPFPFLAEGASPSLQDLETAAPGTMLRTGFGQIVQLAGVLFPWFLLVTALLWLLAWLARGRRAAPVAAVAGLLLLLLALAAYQANDLSWRLLPALVRGYHYDPNVEVPDSSLVLSRPEVLLARQLDALLGQTGASPLRADTPLMDYELNDVHITGWAQKRLTAVADGTLAFADGSTEQVSLSIWSGGGSLIIFPLLGEVNRTAGSWYAPESSLGHLFQAPAPATPLQEEDPPLALLPVAAVEVSDVVEPVEPQTSFVVPSSISAGGDLLVDVDLREWERNVGNAMLFSPAAGESYVLAFTSLSARPSFSPDRQRIAYARRSGYDLELVVREANGSERSVARIDWMTHHWVGNDRIAYSYEDTVYLHDLGAGTRAALASLVPSDLVGSRFFRVSPDGRRLAYVDLDGRLWVREIGGGQRSVGWDVSELSWGSGIAWRPDGEQLVYTALNNVTLPGQAEVWVWDADSGQKRLLARSGPGFLGTVESARLGDLCWLDAETVLFAADRFPLDDVRLLAAHTDGSGLWDVTPPGVTIPFVETHCENGLVAAPLTRTRVGVYGPAGAIAADPKP